MYDNTWTEFEIALNEVVKRLPRLYPEIDYNQPITYANGVTRPKAYIKLKDTIFYCALCGAIPIMQQQPQTKLYRACCPKCRTFAEDGAQRDKEKAYRVWNEEQKRKLNERNF